LTAAPALLEFLRMKRKAKISVKPVRSSQTPTTSAMLYEMEERLNHRMDKGFHRLTTDIQDIKADIGGIKAEIGGIKADIGDIKVEMSGMKSELHRVALLVEEQNARNKYVMDGYAQLYELLAARA
jgi:archaellum component FlaC